MKKKLLVMATAMMIATASWAQTNFKTFTVNGVSFKMIKVEGGTFQMGDATSSSSTERPVHSVTLRNYYIGETEVTQALWQAVMGTLPSRIFSSSRDVQGLQRPVCYVSWENCQEFIRKLNSLTGQRFRLPTEAEWEYAARGGKNSHGYKYSGSNDVDSVAWNPNNSNDESHNVKTKQANELGLYDMSGNVEEWCQDWRGSYSSSAQTNPIGRSSGTRRVSRGGSYVSWGHSVSSRNDHEPKNWDDDLGLRLTL